MINVAFITTHYPPSIGYGGVCESSFGLTQQLAELGVKIDIVTSDSSIERRLSINDFSKYCGKNIHIHAFKYLFGKRNCYSYCSKEIIREQIEKADIVHINGIITHPTTIAAKIARLVGKPYIISPRGGLDEYIFRRKYIKKILAYRFYVKADLLGAACIHAAQEQEINSFSKKELSRPFTIIPNGINSEYFSPLNQQKYAEKRWKILEKKKVVLFLGRLSKEKGIELLINAWELVIKKNKNTILVIAGEDQNRYARKLKKIALKYKAKEKIIFTGLVDGELKKSLLVCAELLVLPSYSESFGNVILESLASGVPVVTTEGTPWKVLNNFDCGRWVSINKNDISEAIIEILDKSKNERRAMGLRGRELILKNYSWDIIARKFITVYKTIIDNSKIPLHPEPWNKSVL